MTQVIFGDLAQVLKNISDLPGPMATLDMERVAKVLANRKLTPQKALIEAMVSLQRSTIPSSSPNMDRAHQFVRAAAGPNQASVVDKSFKGILEVSDAQLPEPKATGVEF